MCNLGWSIRGASTCVWRYRSNTQWCEARMTQDHLQKFQRKSAQKTTQAVRLIEHIVETHSPNQMTSEATHLHQKMHLNLPKISGKCCWRYDRAHGNWHAGDSIKRSAESCTIAWCRRYRNWTNKWHIAYITNKFDFYGLCWRCTYMAAFRKMPIAIPFHLVSYRLHTRRNGLYRYFVCRADNLCAHYR